MKIGWFKCLPFPKRRPMKCLHATVILVLCLIIFACGNTENSKLIIGNWEGAQWIVDGQPSENMANQTSFSFDSTGAYSYQYGSNKETGTYKIANDELYTTPKNELEMMVKIRKLTIDSMVFEMNRGGQSEELILVRK